MFVFSPPSKLHTFCIGIFCIFLNLEVFAQCANYMGKIAEPEEGVYYLCIGGSLILQVDSVVLLDNQELFYVFHTQEDLFFESAVININNTGIYENDGSINGEFFATAIIANTDSLEKINFNNTCLVSSNTVSIVNLNPIEIENEVDCRSTKSFSFSISGGLPEFNEDSFFVVTGSYNSGNVKANEKITVEIENSDYIPQYVISAFDEAGCSASYRSPPVNCSHLPIQLISFKGEETKAGNLLKWVYNDETYLDFFKIEFSKNSVDWMLLNTLKAKGKPLEVTNYEFLDENLCDETCYYRLSEVDLDGTTSLIGIVEISIPRNYLMVYPNPAYNFLNVTYESINNVPFDLAIYDGMGRKIFSYSEEDSLYGNFYKIDISHLSNNMYFLVFSSDDFTKTEKFVIQR